MGVKEMSIKGISKYGLMAFSVFTLSSFAGWWWVGLTFRHEIQESDDIYRLVNLSLRDIHADFENFVDYVKLEKDERKRFLKKVSEKIIGPLEAMENDFGHIPAVKDYQFNRKFTELQGRISRLLDELEAAKEARK